MNRNSFVKLFLGVTAFLAKSPTLVATPFKKTGMKEGYWWRLEKTGLANLFPYMAGIPFLEKCLPGTPMVIFTFLNLQEAERADPASLSF